jgi:DNA-binding NarL/FixJ family response regulator
MGAASRQAPVGVLVVDDDAIVRTWLRGALSGSEFRLVGEAEKAATAVQLVARRRPGLLLVDQILPDWTGTELVRELRLQGVTAPALVMTASPRAGLNEAARAAGAQGTLVKSAEPEDVLRALRAVNRGEESFVAAHPRAAGGEALSPREREVVRLVADGGTNADIAEALAVTPDTVKTMLARACRKLGVQRRSEAVAVASRLGLLDRPPQRS